MNRLYLAAGIAGLSLCLLAYIPASLLYHWSGDSRETQVQLIGIDGNLWRGQAAMANLSGIALRDVQWQWRPQALLMGRISHRIQANTDSGILTAVFSRLLFGSVMRITDLKGNMPISQLGHGINQPLLPFSGNIQLQLDRLHLRAGRPWRADGHVNLNNVDFTFTSPPASLGNYHAELKTVKSVIQLELRSEGGQLEAIGAGQISREGQYQLELRLRPQATAPPAVVSLLQPLGKPTAEGWYLLRQSGAL